MTPEHEQYRRRKAEQDAKYKNRFLERHHLALFIAFFVANWMTFELDELNPGMIEIETQRQPGSSPGCIHFFSCGSYQPFATSKVLPLFATCVFRGTFPAAE